jgi:hypothetical protein
VDYRTHVPLAHSWVAHPFRGEGGAALDTLCHADGGWKMQSHSNEKDIQWMQRTLAFLRLQMSLFSIAEGPNRFPGLIQHHH